MSEAHIDDAGPLDGLAWADMDEGADPFCEFCGDQGERWTIRDGLLVRAACDRCNREED